MPQLKGHRAPWATVWLLQPDATRALYNERYFPLMVCGYAVGPRWRTSPWPTSPRASPLLLAL